MSESSKKEVRRFEGGSMTAGRMVKSETRTVIRRDGVTETVTTEEFTEELRGGATASHTVRTISSADFDRLAIKDDAVHKSKIGNLFSKLGVGHSDKKSSLPSSEEPSSFASDCLKAHNDKRKLHGVPHLKLSAKLNAYAENWANTLAREDSFRHSDGEYGENIFMKWSSNPNHTIKGEDAVNSWYDEIRIHEFGRPSPSNTGSGHFTQVVWKGSKELGVAQARSKTGKVLVVASYFPAGNMMGSYADNVPPPLGGHHRE